MMAYVVDASVAVKWFLPEVHVLEARRLLVPGQMLHAPDFALIEFANVLCKRVRRGQVEDEEADGILASFRLVPMQFHSLRTHFDRAYELAVETRRSLYDCLYLALADLLEVELVTADRRFYDALRDGPLAARLCWIEDLPR